MDIQFRNMGVLIPLDIMTAKSMPNKLIKRQQEN